MPGQGKIHEHRLGLMAKRPCPCPGSYRSLPPFGRDWCTRQRIAGVQHRNVEAAGHADLPGDLEDLHGRWRPWRAGGSGGRDGPAPPFPPTGPPFADPRSGRRSLASVDYIVTRELGIRNKLLLTHHDGHARAVREICPMGHCGHSDERADELAGLRCRTAAAGGSFSVRRTPERPPDPRKAPVPDRPDPGKGAGPRTGGRSGRLTPAAGPGDRRSGQCPAAQRRDAGGSSRPPRPAPWR